MRRLLTLILLLLFAVCSVNAAGVTEYTLKNGLKLLVKSDNRAPVAIFQIWYRVGGSYEPNGLTGISHALEHMMFEGTKQYPNETFSKIITANGGQFNAFTADDYTAYYELLSADKIGLAFKMEADRMQNATLTEKAFKKEIQVVMEERRMRYEDNPNMRLYERLRAAAFLSSPYHHLTIGWMGDLQHLTVQNIRDWYSAWYVPNNATIVVVGAVKPKAMLALAQKYFGTIAKTALLPQKPIINQKPIGERTVNVRLPATVASVIMAYNVPSFTTTKKTWKIYALDVLSGILGGSDSSRLSRNLVRGQQIAAGIGTSYDDSARLETLFSISGVPAKGKTVAQLQQAILEQIKNLQQTPVTDAELSRIKNQVIANKVYAEDSITAQASQLGGLVSVGLPWQMANTFVSNVEKVTAAQVQAVAKQFLTPERLTLGVLHPLPMSDADKQKMQQAQLTPTGSIH